MPRVPDEAASPDEVIAGLRAANTWLRELLSARNAQIAELTGQLGQLQAQVADLAAQVGLEFRGYETALGIRRTLGWRECGMTRAPAGMPGNRPRSLRFHDHCGAAGTYMTPCGP